MQSLRFGNKHESVKHKVKEQRKKICDVISVTRYEEQFVSFSEGQSESKVSVKKLTHNLSSPVNNTQNLPYHRKVLVFLVSAKGIEEVWSFSLRQQLREINDNKHMVLQYRYRITVFRCS